MKYDTNENPVEIAGSKIDSSENKNSVEKKSSKIVIDNEIKESKFEWPNLFFFIIFIIEFFFCAMCVLS